MSDMTTSQLLIVGVLDAAKVWADSRRGPCVIVIVHSIVPSLAAWNDGESCG